MRIVTLIHQTINMVRVSHHTSVLGRRFYPHLISASTLQGQQTSYESHASSHLAQPGPAYNSRVEEAALLLNFQSGGWPGNPANLPPPPGPAPRPHAKSFPQDAFHMRPAEVTPPPLQSALLPPFNPQDAHQPPPTLPSPEHTITDVGPSPKVRESANSGDVEMLDVSAHIDQQPQQTQTPPDDTDSRSASADVAISEASEAPKSRRGWPKGKPRGSGSRKTMAEKAASKRAASRKKTPEARAGREKSDGVASGLVRSSRSSAQELERRTRVR